MSYGISREEEYRLPRFESHDEARKYFKDKYGDNFQLMDSDTMDGEKIYFYKLILDKEAYYEMIAKLESNGVIPMCEKYLFCTQNIQISENGRVHIVH